MSRDARVDVPRALAHLVEAHRLAAVLLDRAADEGVEADVGELLAVVDPDLAAVVLLDDVRGAVAELGGHAALEGVGRLDDVVVGRDHQQAAVGPRRVGQQRDRALLPALGGGEVRVVGQVVQRAHRGPPRSCERSVRSQETVSRLRSGTGGRAVGQSRTSGSRRSSRRTAPSQNGSSARSSCDAFIPTMNCGEMSKGSLPMRCTS